MDLNRDLVLTRFQDIEQSVARLEQIKELPLTEFLADRDVLDVRSGEVRRLTLEPGAASAVVQGRFRFDPVTLAWGGDALAQALPCHLFVVDELGPLELQRGEGWIRALDVLHAADFTLALVVVRPELVEPAQSALPPSATTVIPVTTRNRDELPQALWEMLEEKPASTF